LNVQGYKSYKSNTDNIRYIVATTHACTRQCC